MALQSSGAISLDDIATEFGGSTPHALSEYYGVATGIPSSGTIALSDFYGASASAGSGGSGGSGSTATLTPSNDQSSTSHDRKGYGEQGKCDFFYPESVGGTHDDAFGSLTNTTGLISNCTVTSIAIINSTGSYPGTTNSKILLVQVQSSGTVITQSAFSSIQFVGPTSSSSGNVTVSIATNAGSLNFGTPFRLNQSGVANMYQWAWLLGTWDGVSYSSGTSGLTNVWNIISYGVTNNSTVGITIS